MSSAPDKVLLHSLEAKSSEYQSKELTWRRIQHLFEGGHVIEVHKQDYLPKRPDEPPALYKIRLAKFTYRNLLGSSIQQQVNKLAAGTFQISGLTDDSFWQLFREDVDRRGTPEPEYLAHLFRQVLLFGAVYTHVDKPYSSIKPRNKAEEEALNLRAYLTTYSALEVYDEGFDALNQMTFLKVRQLSQRRASVFEQPKDHIVWTYITQDEIATYEADVKLNGDRILAVYDEKGEERIVDSETTIPLARPIQHQYPSFPVIKLEVPSDLWLGNQVIFKCLEHITLDNCLYDGASVTAYVQRTFEPFVTPIDSIADVDEDTIATGNAYVMKGKFSFEEMSGAALTVLSDLLKQLEEEINSIVSIGYSSSSKDAVQQSGISKKVDKYKEEMLLRQFGKRLLSTWQDILQLAARISGYRSDSISASGFNSFDLDNVDDLLLQAEALQKVKPFLTATAFKLFCAQLNVSLAPNASAEELAAIQSEVQSLTQPEPQSSPAPPSTNEEPDDDD
ncbi:MAG: hypothetical protein KME18_07915 [Phormidium tanganyikae FI6-MK23]|nr:hypothetical protein [Phormidium tanganyikae FI6-MK23]